MGGEKGISPILTGSTITNSFIYDNEDILLELDGTNNIVARYTHGPGIDEPLILEKGGQSFFYHADGLGSITEISNQAGSVVQRYTYSSFGKIESQLDPNFLQPYTFTAREFDPETDVYFYRHRTYDWRTGRFHQEDPILHAGNRDVPYSLPFLLSNPQMLNPYAYAQNNPVVLTDPSGLASCNGWWKKQLVQPIAFGFCVCYWLCLPCDGTTIWGGNPFTLPFTTGVTTGQRNCSCGLPGPETGCECPPAPVPR